MFNEDYYKGKEEEVLKKFNAAKDVLIQDMFNLLNKFSETQKDLQERFDEIIAQKEESAKKKVEAEKKKIEEAVIRKGGK